MYKLRNHKERSCITSRIAAGSEIACLVLIHWQNRDKPEKRYENHWAIRKPLSMKYITEGQSILFIGVYLRS